MKIVFFGASRFVLPVIEVLQKNFELALIVTTEQKITDVVPAYCRLQNINYISVSKFDENVKAQLRKIEAPIGVLGYFGLILPKSVLQIFPKGILNVHPSLLPLYRGATPIQTAIFNGDLETGVTIIKLDEQMDHGPILAQVKARINETDTAEDLYDRLFRKGAEILEKVIPEYFQGTIVPKIQDEKGVTFTKPSFTRQDGYFDVNNPPSKKQIERMIRAYYPWPGVWTKVTIKDSEFRIKFLPGEKIQAEGKRPMSVKDFFNGYPELKGVIHNLLR